jgi:hypothetical protein
VDKELLFKPRLEEAEVELDGIGTLRIRALSRDEVASARDDHTDRNGEVDGQSYEHTLVAAAMVDPQLTVDEVGRWAAASPAGELVKVIEAIQELSGLTEDAAKSGVSRNRRERRAAARAHRR